MNNIGKVSQIFRYPVKSMAGEELQLTYINKKGLLGDRTYALIDIETNKIVSAKNPKKWTNIFKYFAKYTKESAINHNIEIQIEFPNKQKYLSSDAFINEKLSESLGRKVKLTSTVPEIVQLEEYHADIIEIKHHGDVSDADLAKGTFFDLGTIHLITTATLKKFEDFYNEGIFSVNRFRPNLVIETNSHLAGFVENEWIGKKISIGKEVILEIKQNCPRCVMTTLEQNNLPKDINILKTILKKNHGHLGVYADVICEGIINNGDEIKILEENNQ